jgi:hypothetical protein
MYSSPGVWVMQGSLLAGDNSDSQAGTSVSINDNGNFVLVGCPGANGGAGEVQFWELIGVWSLTQTIPAPSNAIGAAHFGFAVALSGDGITLAVGGPMDDVHGAWWSGHTTERGESQAYARGRLGDGCG